MIVLHGRALQSEKRSANEFGIFLFPAEPVGTYTLEVAAKGLRNTVVNGLVVQVGQTTAVNIEMQPGPGNESMTVTGEPPLFRIEDSEQVRS
jgi:hypothetical protein